MVGDRATDVRVDAPEQTIELCFTVGLSNMVNRFHAIFLTEVDPQTQEALAPSCPLSYPDVPTV